MEMAFERDAVYEKDVAFGISRIGLIPGKGVRLGRIKEFEENPLGITNG